MEEVLDLKFQSSDLNKTLSIRDFLKELLLALWDEQEGFSGKRPFGKSGWTGDIEVCLVKAGFVNGVVDGDGWLESIDEEDFSRMMKKLIGSL